MDLFNRACDPSEEARRLADAARGESVTAERLGCREVPGLLGTRLFGERFLADRPLVGYLQSDEQPHHVFVLGGVDPEDGEYVGATGGYSVVVAITDLRMLFAVGHSGAPDESLTIPYDAVAGMKSAPENLWLRTDDEKYRIPVENSIEAEAARDYVLDRADAKPEGYLADAEVHDLSKTAEGDRLWSQTDARIGME